MRFPSIRQTSVLFVLLVLAIPICGAPLPKVMLTPVAIHDFPGGALPYNTTRGRTVAVIPGEAYDISGSSGAGSICWNQGMDTFQFAYTRLIGDFDISVVVTDIPDMPDNATVIATLHARESLDCMSPAIGLNLYNRDCREFNEPGHMVGRNFDAGCWDLGWVPAKRQYERHFPAWARMTRQGDTFKTYYCNDGKNWRVVDQLVAPLSQVLYVGLGSTSKDPVRFRRLQIDGTLAPALPKPAIIGTGTGLMAEYFAGKTFDTPLFARPVPQAALNFGYAQTPDPMRMKYGNYAVRLTGAVQAQFTEPHTFVLGVDDGARVWLDDVLLLDTWIDQGYTYYYTTRDLVAGKKYKLRIDYYDARWGGSVRLYWKSPSQELQLIPRRQLYPNPAVKATAQPPKLAKQRPGGTVYEAEQALLSDATVLGDKPGASGGRYVGGTQGRSEITFTHVDGGDGKRLHSLSIRYSAPEDDPMRVHRNLYVNGELMGGLTFFAEANWRDVIPYVKLKPGKTNTITLRNDGGSPVDVQIDRLVVDGEPRYFLPTSPWPASKPEVDLDGYVTHEAVQLPDLIVTDISWSPAKPAPGDRVTFSATVKNIGNAPTPEGTILGVLFHVPATGVFTWSDDYTHALAPGASATVTACGGNAGATWAAVSGAFMVRAVVDDVSRFDELDRANNTSTDTITVP